MKTMPKQTKSVASCKDPACSETVAAKNKMKELKNKKKLTCRQDKLRGRKARGGVLEPKPGNTAKNKPQFDCKGDGICLMCVERFSDSAAGEKWIKCRSARVGVMKSVQKDLCATFVINCV